MADNSKTTNDWDKREIGALWTRTSQSSGKKYSSGHFKVDTEFGEEKKIPVVAFFNKDIKAENQPIFRVQLQSGIRKALNQRLRQVLPHRRKMAIHCFNGILLTPPC